jgi:hypothetical protein
VPAPSPACDIGGQNKPKWGLWFLYQKADAKQVSLVQGVSIELGAASAQKAHQRGGSNAHHE